MTIFMFLKVADRGAWPGARMDLHDIVQSSKSEPHRPA